MDTSLRIRGFRAQFMSVLLPRMCTIEEQGLALVFKMVDPIMITVGMSAVPQRFECPNALSYALMWYAP